VTAYHGGCVGGGGGGGGGVNNINNISNNKNKQILLISKFFDRESYKIKMFLLL